MDDFEVRREALAHAVQLAAKQQIGQYDAAVVVNMAGHFEKYLLGEEGK